MTATASYPSLQGRVVLITGGATGIGACLVESFAAQGAKVGFIDIDDAPAHALVQKLAGAAHAPAYVRADLTDVAALQGAIAQVRDRFGPIRALLVHGADYPEQANDHIVRFAMIETAQALDNLDDILSVEGLDAVYIGPSDLSLSLGCRPVFDDVDPKA